MYKATTRIAAVVRNFVDMVINKVMVVAYKLNFFFLK